MDVEIVIGPKESFYPYLIESAAFVELFEGRYRPIPAVWISPRCGRYYHDFLLDDDSARRASLFGEFVVDNVGRDRGALLLFPSLLSSSSEGPALDPTMAAAVSGIVAHLPGFRVGFRILRLGVDDISSDLQERYYNQLKEEFAEQCEARGQSIHCDVLDVDPTSAVSRTILKNRTLPVLRKQIADRLHERGYVCGADLLAQLEKAYGSMAATIHPGTANAGARDLADFLIDKALFR